MICLIRHGCTDYNIQNYVQGWSDVTINEEGEAQIQETVKKICCYDWDLIVSSDLHRAKRSADIISRMLNVEIIENADLREKRPDSGVVGKKYEELQKHNLINEDEENIFSFYRRVRKATDDILSKYQGNIIIVSHMEVLRFLVFYLTGTNIKCINNGQNILLEKKGEEYIFCHQINSAGE